METQSHKFKITLIEPEDFPWGVEVAAVRMLREEVKRPELINLSTLYLIVNKMYEDGTGLIAWDGEKRVGAMGGYLAPNLFNPNLGTLSELIWWVDPDYRKTRVGAMLLSAYEKMALESEAHDGTLSLLPSSPVNFKSLEKREWTLAEQAFRRVFKEV